MREADAFVHALRFMTILPLPQRGEQLEPDWLAQASRYFPAAGIVIGLVSAMVLVAANQVWVGFLPAILAARMGRVPVVLDGFSAGAAAAALYAADPRAIDHCISGHV